jgi:hypothetical protein
MISVENIAVPKDAMVKCARLLSREAQISWIKMMEREKASKSTDPGVTLVTIRSALLQKSDKNQKRRTEKNP